MIRDMLGLTDKGAPGVRELLTGLAVLVIILTAPAIDEHGNPVDR